MITMITLMVGFMACILGGFGLTSVLSVFVPMITNIITLCSSGGTNVMTAFQSLCNQIPGFIASLSSACEQLPGATAPAVI